MNNTLKALLYDEIILATRPAKDVWANTYGRDFKCDYDEVGVLIARGWVEEPTFSPSLTKAGRLEAGRYRSEVQHYVDHKFAMWEYEQQVIEFRAVYGAHLRELTGQTMQYALDSVGFTYRGIIVTCTLADDVSATVPVQHNIRVKSVKDLYDAFVEEHHNLRIDLAVALAAGTVIMEYMNADYPISPVLEEYSDV